MATLNDSDFQTIREIIHQHPEVIDTFESWNLDKATWKSLFQAAEDWFVNGFTVTPTESFKAALDTIVTTTNAQAKWIGKVWFLWRIGITW